MLTDNHQSRCFHRIKNLKFLLKLQKKDYKLNILKCLLHCFFPLTFKKKKLSGLKFSIKEIHVNDKALIIVGILPWLIIAKTMPTYTI